MGLIEHSHIQSKLYMSVLSKNWTRTYPNPRSLISTRRPEACGPSLGTLSDLDALWFRLLGLPKLRNLQTCWKEQVRQPQILLP